MQINFRQYPHPVLSYFSDDVPDVDFQTALKPTKTHNTYIFDASAITSCDGLREYVVDRKAKYAFHIECQSTRYRRMFTSFEDKFSFEIKADELNGKVEICSFIISTADNDQYRLEEFHIDYGDHYFSIKKGDILAIDNERVFYADNDIDPLQKIPSIFSVVPNYNDDALPMDFDASGNKIVVSLSPENFERYKYLSVDQNLQPLLSALIIVPSLVSLIESIKGIEDALEYEDCRWYQVIKQKLKSLNINLATATDSTVIIAHKLIGDPLTHSLAAIENLEAED
ncbi:hypothetical protein [Paenibacillus luteus]|uniref:hypothetical protein n=1 Tax=Paenibacillus luteus TaxID=2545753 RepID=UPI00114484F9|nr:hypothetical protein [Paenibacillus luteus]